MADGADTLPTNGRPSADALAVHAVRRLLDGHAPNGVRPEDCGRWADDVDALFHAYDPDAGVEAVHRAWRAVEKRSPAFAALVASHVEGDDPLAGLRVISAADLMRKELPEPDWLAEGVVPEGLTLLAAAPKIGKTFLALNLSIAVATGGVAFGKSPAKRGRVFYLDLDGSERGMQRRIRAMLQGESAPASFVRIAPPFPRLQEGAEEKLAALLRHFPDTALVVIDTLKGIRPHDAGRRNAYDVDYEALAPLRALCEEHGVSMLVVHHTNKRTDGDELTNVNGTYGLTGAAENILVMTRERGQMDAKLTVRPREEEEAEFGLTFDSRLQTWILAGRFEDFAKTKERQRILDLIRENGAPMRAQEICDALDGGSEVRRLLRKMVDAGTLSQPQPRGPYGLPTALGHIGNEGNEGTLGHIGNRASVLGPVTGDRPVTDVTDVTGGLGADVSRGPNR